MIKYIHLYRYYYYYYYYYNYNYNKLYTIPNNISFFLSPFSKILWVVFHIFIVIQLKTARTRHEQQLVRAQFNKNFHIIISFYVTLSLFFLLCSLESYIFNSERSSLCCVVLTFEQLKLKKNLKNSFYLFEVTLKNSMLIKTIAK